MSDLQDDLLTDDLSNDDLVAGTLGDDKDETSVEEDEVLDDEKAAVSDEDMSEPEGLRHTDPGINDEAVLDADAWQAGVGDKDDEEDVEALGFHVEDGSGDASGKIDTFGDDSDV